LGYPIRMPRLLAAALAAALIAPAAAQSHDGARVFVTTPDRALQLSDQGRAPFTRGAPTISVDPRQSFQTMEGWGASITDSSAAVLYRLDKRTRDRAMTALFKTDGLSYLRQPMGASDFVDEPHYTYDDVPPGETDYGMRHFSIAHDETQILPLLRQALQLNPRLKVMATPWSPPAWMKTNGSLIGGRLIDDPKIYRAYADYFVHFIKAYARAGVPMDAVTVQNEPQNRNPSGYPGMDMPVAQEAKLIEALGPALKQAGLRTKILGYDHNWSEHPNDVANTPPGEDPETEYPTLLLSSPAAPWIAGTAFHCYSGDASRQSLLHDAFPAKDVYFTECSGSHGESDTPEQIFAGTLGWHADNLIIATARNWAKTMINWNLALDPAGGPHNGGCGTCTGVITVGPGDTFSYDAEYFTLGHAARFVQPGAVRIASSEGAAFRNRDGTIALIVHNTTDAARPVRVGTGSRSAAYTLPPGALATFVWR
jgi:glucosylceramidase